MFIFLFSPKNEKTDIGFQNFIVMPERFLWIGYLAPYENEKVCFMAPNQPNGSSWHQYLQIFDLKLWCGTIMFWIACVIFIVK